MIRAGLATCLLLVAASAHAEVKQSAPDGFFLRYSEPIAATPAKLYADLALPAKWWSDEHTWSGKAANMSLKAEAGGCFCERWPGGSAEHGRVVMALPDQLLRLDAALGPLQEFALKGVLSFWIRSGDDGATRLDVEYRVNGTAASGLDAFAPAVDKVLGAQVARLKRFIESGDPSEPPPPLSPAVQNSRAREAILKAWKQSATEEKSAKKPVPEKKPEPPSH